MDGARVVEILIAESANAPMRSIREPRPVAGRGLAKDRYFSNAGTFSPSPQKPDFEITLIERECVEAFARESGLPFTTLNARRNLVTVGASLNDLVGADFFVGEVLLRGI